MNDQKLDDLFDQPIPKADINAKKIAINAALSEFSQGTEKSTRLIDNRDNWFSKTLKSIGSYLMTPQKNSRFNATFASLAVAFIGASVYFLLPNDQKQFNNEINSKKNIHALEPSTTVKEDLFLDTAQFSASEPQTEEIVVTGRRATIQSSIEQKRITTEIADGLSSDEIGDIPALSIGEALPIEISPSRSRTIQNQPITAPSVDKEVTTITSNRLDSNEEHPEYETNSIKQVKQEPVSTFSVDVDTASYSLIRNQLNNGYLPKPQAVRAEELINYFNYDYPLPKSKNRPFQPTVSVLDSPWNKGKKLVHIGIKGYDLDASNTPDSNLVFLLDVSGSMDSVNKLPLVKQSVNLLLDTLKPTDTVSIVVYAGAAGVVLEPTKVQEKTTILSALNRLNAGGSTAGGQGIELAYQLAEQNFKQESVNRIILATDGDFNVGQSSNESLQTLVERKRDNGVFLSILGFGRNNYQDDMMQTLAQNGNGVAAYIDTLSEAKKVLVDEATSTLFTIAKDVKIQVEFNPNTVSEYRLIGYETRALKREDFNNDKVDAGDIGAGHTVTAVYELTPVDSENQSIDKPRYADNLKSVKTDKNSNEYGFVKIRYKSPTGTKSKLIEQMIPAQLTKNENSEILFSTAVAGFAQLLTGGKYTGDLSYSDVVKLASEHKGQDDFGYRTEFIQLVRMAEIAKP